MPSPTVILSRAGDIFTVHGTDADVYPPGVVIDQTLAGQDEPFLEIAIPFDVCREVAEAVAGMAGERDKK